MYCQCFLSIVADMYHQCVSYQRMSIRIVSVYLITGCQYVLSVCIYHYVDMYCQCVSYHWLLVCIVSVFLINGC